MTAAELLTTLRDHGLTISADGDALIVRPRDLLTDDLRATIRARKPELLAELTVANESQADASADPGTERRRAKARALLEANPNWRRVVIAEAGEPAIIGIAVRTLGYSEIEIPAAKYDAAALITLLDQYARSTQ